MCTIDTNYCWPLFPGLCWKLICMVGSRSERAEQPQLSQPAIWSLWSQEARWILQEGPINSGNLGARGAPGTGWCHLGSDFPLLCPFKELSSTLWPSLRWDLPTSTPPWPRGCSMGRKSSQLRVAALVCPRGARAVLRQHWATPSASLPAAHGMDLSHQPEHKA